MFTTTYLSTLIGAEINGFSEYSILKINEISQAASEGHGTISWISDKMLTESLFNINCTVICSPMANGHPALQNANLFIVTNPRQAFAIVLREFAKLQVEISEIHGSAILDSSSQIGTNFSCGPYVVIEKNVQIGDDVVIGANSVIKRGTIIGNRVNIGSNCTIGGVGFGYEKNDEGNYEVLPHLGNVTLEDYVEIGNNTCIDRAVLGTTLLRKNVKVDNLVHIAHGCDIGENSLIIANSMIAGSVTIGSHTWVAPSSSILNKITIGGNVTIGMGAVVLKPVEDGDVVVGSPAKSIRKI